MADTPISGLSAVTDVQATDEYVLARAGDNKKITGASLISELGGAGGGGPVVLFDTTLGSPASVIDSNGILGGNISGSYTHLRLMLLLRNSGATLSDIVKMRFNNDSGANYYWQTFIMNNATTTPAQGNGATSLDVGYMSGASSPASLFQSTIVEIPFYAMSSVKRTFLAFGNLSANSSGNIYSTRASGDWNNTAAITRIQILPTANNIDTGSRVILYGTD